MPYPPYTPTVRRPGLLVACCVVTLVLLPLYTWGVISQLSRVSSGSFVDITTLLVLAQGALLVTYFILAWGIGQAPFSAGGVARLTILTASVLGVWLALSYVCQGALEEGIGPFQGEWITRRVLNLTFLLPFHVTRFLFGSTGGAAILPILLLLLALLALALLPVLSRRGFGSFTAWLTFLSLGYTMFLFGGGGMGDGTMPDGIWPLLAGLIGGLGAGSVALWGRSLDRRVARITAWAGTGAVVGAGCAAIGGGCCCAAGRLAV